MRGFASVWTCRGYAAAQKYQRSEIKEWFIKFSGYALGVSRRHHNTIRFRLGGFARIWLCRGYAAAQKTQQRGEHTIFRKERTIEKLMLEFIL